MLQFLEMLIYWILCFVESCSLENVFMKLVNMSISAGWLILAVLILRIFLKKSPKWVNVLLWGLVAIRLISPFNFESTLSLIPSAETVPMDIGMDPTPNVDSGINIVNNVVNPIVESAYSPPTDTVTSANPLQIWIPIYAGVWFLSMVVLLLYTAVSYWRLCRRVNTAVLYRDNIFQSENVSSPFVLGIIKPRIYLPFGLEGQAMEHVVAHEQAHIKRKDHWWKPVGFLLLTVYWFNPLIWLAYILLCRDIEIACDEKVIKKLDNGQKADYTQALVTCSVNRRTIAACPLAFGEVGVKERVKSVMNYKRPAFWTILISVLACITVAVCFLTNPKPDTASAYSQILGLTGDEDQKAQIPVLEISDLKNGEEFQFRDIPWGSSVEEVKAIITSAYDWWEVGKEQYNTTESYLLMGEAVNPIYKFKDDKLSEVQLLYDQKNQEKQFNVLVEELTNAFGTSTGKDESVTGNWYYSWHTDNSAIQINTLGKNNDGMIFFIYSKEYRDSEVINGETEIAVTFLDEMQNVVQAEALWYNIAKVESIHVQWTETTPNTVRMYYMPSGTDVSEPMQLLLTKTPQTGDQGIVLSMADVDKTDMFGHLEIELDYGDRKITSEFNVVYDTEWAADTEMSSVTDDVLEIFSRVYDYHDARYSEGTTYAVNNLALLEHSQTEALVEVEIVKDGVVQMKRHHIRLQLVDGIWEITEVVGNEMVYALNRIFYMTNRDVSVQVEKDIELSEFDSPYVGTIQSVVDGVMLPTEDLQANFDCEGAGVVFFRSGIAVNLDGKWIEFDILPVIL